MKIFKFNIRQSGFSLMEVLVGIVIFSIGMLALGSLQGALTRSMAEAKVRTEAVNIAEETIEAQRGFFQIATTVNTLAYADITDATQSVTRNNVSYTVTQDVTDYYYDLQTDSFNTTAPTGITISNYKTVMVTVAWADDRNFVINEGNEMTASSLGGGEIQLTGSIAHVSVAAAGRVLSESEQTLDAPPVDYNPGQRPDVVSLSLGDNKFKESLLPEPDVIRRDELVETRFDVITYSQTNAGAIFLRREEFMTVACDCILKAPPGDAESAGRRPVVWAGDEYVRGYYVDKPYGVSANSQQSQFCNECCQDHHDGGSHADDHGDTAVNKMAPFKLDSEYISDSSSPFRGDHKHWNRARNGALVEAVGDGDVYVEACRMVRQDGYFRVAQDFRQEDLHAFPIDYLDDSGEIAVYSDYATGAAIAYAEATYVDYENAPPCIGGPSCEADPPMQSAYSSPIATDADGNPTQMPSWTTLPLGANAEQQLRSRGLYIDYLSYDLRRVLEYCNPDSHDADDDACKSGDVILNKTGSVNPLELIPFFDVQMTYLNRWNESPINVPVDTTNEALADHNAHSRGVISKSVDGALSTVMSSGHRGNLGFTDTQPIDLSYESFVSSTEMMVWTGGGEVDSDTKLVASAEHPVLPRVPDGEREIAEQSFGARAAPRQIGHQDDLCIADGRGTLTQP